MANSGIRMTEGYAPVRVGLSNNIDGDEMAGRSDVTPFNLADIPVLQTGQMGSNYKRRN
jgi:hypothetical protein